jgi:hypothetical protein
MQIGVLALAALAILALPALAVQTVRLDGISFFGWHLVEGALAARDAARQGVAACHSAGAALDGALARQNAQVAALARASADAQARAQAALAAARAQSAKAAATEAQILAARPGADLCQSADALILEDVR